MMTKNHIFSLSWLAAYGNIVAAIPTKETYLVKGLEDAEPAYKTFDGEMYAGLIPTEPFHKSDNDGSQEYEGRLMFWMFQPKAPKYTDTLVIWLNGGPGCSSMGGCLFENCPVTIPMHPAGFFGTNQDPKILKPNPYAWTNATAMMYVEQPHGTGFSTGPFPNNEEDLSRDFYQFLQNLYAAFGEDLRSKKLYFFGESYAGMYAPSIAHYIHEQNKKKTNVKINLSGIGLGNGWMDARIQGPAVIDYAWWHGMIDSHTAKAMHNEWENCQQGKAVERGGDAYTGFHEFTVPDECGIMGAVLQAAGANQVPWGLPNAYDVSTWDPYLMLDDPKGAMANFYNNPQVQEALNVKPGTFWIECMPGAGRRRLEEEDPLPGKLLLAHDTPESTVPYVADLLDDAGIRVLIYNGDRDMTTNVQGSEVALDTMNWSGAAGWADSSKYERGLWLVKYDNVTAGGYMKQYKNLQFLTVINSGHLVPYNEPQLALELVTRFLGEESFIDKPLPAFDITTEKDSSKSNQQPTSEFEAGYYTKQNNSSPPPRHHHYFGTFFFAIVAFCLGFFISRKFPGNKERQGYQSISSAEMS